MQNRRSLLGSILAVGGVGVLARSRLALAAAPAKVTIVMFTDAGVSEGPMLVDKVVKTEAQWRAQLPAASFEVARQAGTERPFSGPYNSLHDHGLFRCICCGTALYSSDTKFESGTGWPSFYQPIAKQNVVEKADHTLGMQRTEILCARCDAHLGHVFDDGPRPTGLRYCMNSVALKFVKHA
ncbi:MAG TPA: peptide-methionine (R)-S-oxide reductase MsrB [Steroidobacteraceae bacterium]|jgi:peptide-methionine (R)-S-oxide reductase